MRYTRDTVIRDQARNPGRMDVQEETLGETRMQQQYKRMRFKGAATFTKPEGLQQGPWTNH
jgi:hypothetical protein